MTDVGTCWHMSAPAGVVTYVGMCRHVSAHWDCESCWLIVPLSKAFHAALLLSTQEQSGYLWGQICKPWRQVACERLYTPRGVEMDIQMDMECKGPMTREGTCQSLQSRALSLDVDSKQRLYLLLLHRIWRFYLEKWHQECSNVKIGYWVIVHVFFNELWCWYSNGTLYLHTDGEIIKSTWYFTDGLSIQTYILNIT